MSLLMDSTRDPIATDHAEVGTIMDGTIYTGKIIATLTYAKEREREKYTLKLDPFLNCLHKYTLNKGKQNDVFHQFSFDPSSIDTRAKIFCKISTRTAKQCSGHYAVIFIGTP